MNQMNLNLLPSKAKFQKKKIELLAKTRVYMLIVSGVWCLILLTVLAMNLVVNIRSKTLVKRYSLVKNDYLGLADSVITSQNLKYRAKLIGGVIASRFEYSRAFKAIKILLPVGVVMDDFEMTKRGVFSIKASAVGGNNVDELEKLIFEINSNNNEYFNNAKILTMSTKNDVWIFDLEVSMK